MLENDIHNHQPDDAEVGAEKIVSRLKTKVQETALTNTYILPWKIQELATYPDKEEMAQKHHYIVIEKSTSTDASN